MDNTVGVCRKHRSKSTARKQYMNNYMQQNRDTLLAYKKEYGQKNKKKLNRARKKLLTENVNARLSHALRTRVNRAIKAKFKAGSVVKNLGCTIAHLKTYLESKFKPGMTWENWGILGWHIDHIKPLSKFDLSDEAQFKQASHYTNLQPLWWNENLAKHARI